MDRLVFHALPTPATLIDADGLIVDLNGAFLEYARQLGQRADIGDRRGRHILDFAADPGARARLREALDQVLAGATAAYDTAVTVEGGGSRQYRVTGIPLVTEAGALAGGIVFREDVTVERRRDARRRLLHRLHGAVWGMASGTDLEKVLVAVRDGLRELDLPFDDCGVNLIDERAEPPEVRAHNMLADGQWVDVHSPSGTQVVLQIWRAGRTVYRRDLQADDTFDEADEIARIVGRRVRSVVDVPFGQGTFALNSRLPAAFSDADVELIEEIARELGDGFSRLAALEALEAQNRALRDTIAERERAELALRESELQYRHVVENLPIGVSHTAPDGRVLYLNPYAQRALGYTPGELSRLSVYELYVDPADRQALVLALTDKGEHAYEVRWRTRDDRVIWLRGRTRVVRDDAGEILYYQSFAEDVTETRRQEAEARAVQTLREEVWRMENTQEIDRVIVTVREVLDTLDIDVDGCAIHIIDDTSEPPTVTSLRNRRGDTEWVQAISEEARDVIVAMWRGGEPVYRRDLATLDEHGEAERIAENYGKAPRSVLDVPFSRGTLGINSGRPDAFTPRDIEALGRLADVLSEGFRRVADIDQLERRNMELEQQIEERRRLEGQLQRSQRLEAVGQLTAGLAHNFNNILQTIVGNVELARLDESDAGPMLEEAAAAAGRAGEIIRHMLVFSRQGDRQERQIVDVDQLVEQTVAICRRTFDRRIELDLQIGSNVPATIADAGQLEQVLLNLMINARDAVQDVADPRLTIRVERRQLALEELSRDDAQAGFYAAVAVGDNGAGISAQDQQRIFDPFFTTKPIGEGTGLGLFTAYGIVDSFGGWIECSSRPGGGARFSILLPEAPGEATRRRGETDTEIPRGTETILVIDDESAVLTTVSRMLQALGYQVLCAGGGVEGLAQIDAGTAIDLVLLDLSMPRMSGTETWAQIHARRPDLKVLIFTGYAAGATPPVGVPVMHKPFTMQSLGRSLRAALDGAPPQV